VAERQFGQLFASADEERLGRNQERTCFQLGKLCKRIIDLAIALGTQNVKLETKTASGRPRTVQSPACGILVNKRTERYARNCQNVLDWLDVLDWLGATLAEQQCQQSAEHDAAKKQRPIRGL
jgi:hypothetical protein